MKQPSMQENRVEDIPIRAKIKKIKSSWNKSKVKNNDLKMITVVGASMGAHIASRLTEKNSFSTLILRAPACYRKDYENKKMVKDWIPWDRERKYWPWQPSFALDAIVKFTGRLLVVKGEEDEV